AGGGAQGGPADRARHRDVVSHEPGPVRQDDELHQARARGRCAARVRRLAPGFFVEPTVFADVTDDMRIAREEIFGPVVSILRWSDEEDLLERVNALDYGLTASIWTHDLDRAHRLASKVEAGYIWVNGASTHHVGVPFGGVKQSGIGREESIEELLACTQIKNVNVTLQRHPHQA